MLDQETQRAPVIVRLPGEIDLANQEDAFGKLCAAFTSGAPVVIADLTATTFCSCSSLRALLAVQQRAACDNAQLYLAIRPGTAVSRVAELIGLGRLLPVYPSVEAAS